MKNVIEFRLWKKCSFTPVIFFFGVLHFFFDVHPEWQQFCIFVNLATEILLKNWKSDYKALVFIVCVQ